MPAPLGAVELEPRRAVPLDPEPAERALDLLDRLLHLAARVGVLDPQQALAAAAAREEPVEEERAHATDVEEPGRARCHADADAHQAAIVGADASPRSSAGSVGGPCSSAPTSRRPAASGRRSTGRGDRAATRSRCSPRARACGGRRTTRPRRLRASASGVRRPGSRASSATRSISSTSPRPTAVIHDKSVAAMRASLEAADAIGAEGVIFHVGSHLGDGLRARARAGRPGPPRAARADDRRPLAADGELRRHRRNDRALDGRARAIHDALDHHPRLGICLDSCHWYASGVDVTDPAALDAAVADARRRIGLDRLRCLHVNDSKAGSARTATATSRSGAG